MVMQSRPVETLCCVLEVKSRKIVSDLLTVLKISEGDRKCMYTEKE